MTGDRRVFSKRNMADATHKKTQQILSSRRETTKAVENVARSIAKSKICRRFFDDLYSLNYKGDELRERRFLNIGPGSFRHRYWRTADKKYGEKSWTESRRGVEQPLIDYQWDICSGESLNEKDGFFLAIYSSHVIEHLFENDVRHLLQEVHRLLRNGGCFRIVCPDIELMKRAYQSEDWGFFLHYLSPKTLRLARSPLAFSQNELREIAAEFVIDWVSLAAHQKNPNRISKGTCASFIDGSANFYHALDTACSMSDRAANQEIGAHVNWFNEIKLRELLLSVGFSDVRLSGYLQSSVAIMRDPVLFDKTDPEMSLFIEAFK